MNIGELHFIRYTSLIETVVILKLLCPYEGIEGNDDIGALLSVIIVQLTLDKISRLLSVKKIFLIDEALDFLKGDIGEFIGAMYRKITKQGGSDELQYKLFFY